jgi:hypothetical protein
MKRKLISSDQATLAPKQITQPCSDCPWARDALAGWLGDNTAEEWIRMARGETRIPCHVHPNVQCAGASVYLANVAKLPRDPELLRLPADREAVFATPGEFIAHHAETPERRLRRKAAGADVIEAAHERVINRLDEVAAPLTQHQYQELLHGLKTDVEIRLEEVAHELKRKAL